MTTRYRTIVSDPPWTYEEGFAGWGETNGVVNKRELPYGSMSLGAIADLPVASWAERDAFLFLWTTNRYLRDAFWISDAWGFRYRQTLVWDKMGAFNPFTGSVTPNQAEYLLVCRRGNPKLLARWPGGSVIQAPRAAHSQKPEVFLDLVEMVAPGPYLEMFSRRARLGWDTWGDEALNNVGSLM